jgi:hypothetical protein
MVEQRPGTRLALSDYGYVLTWQNHIEVPASDSSTIKR